SDNALPTFNSGFFLGSFNGSGEFTDGTLDDVRIWTVARSQAEIQQSFCGGVLAPQSGLIHEFVFDHGAAGGSNAGITAVANNAMSGAPGLLQGFELSGNASNWVAGKAAYGNIIYVNDDASGANDGTSWANAFNDLQDALALANQCSNITEIWVAAGTYYPDEGAGQTDNDRGSSFNIGSNISLYGGFQGVVSDDDVSDANPAMFKTILSGDLQQNDLPGFGNYGDNARNVVRIVDAGGKVILDGFYISGGEDDALYSGITDGTGAGVYISTNGPQMDVELNRCVIQNNRSNRLAGGLYIGIPFTSIPNPFLRLTNCVFENNHAAQASAFMNAGAIGTIENCVFLNNVTSNFGTIYSSNSLTITNSTIFSTEWVYNDGELVLHNSIFLPAQIYNSNTITISNTLLSTGIGSIPGAVNDGGGNLLYDPMLPLFVNSSDPDGPDNCWRTTDDGLSITTCSPAINAGDNAAVPAGITTDLVGNPRFYSGGIIDIGAYEYQGMPAAPCTCSNTGTVSGHLFVDTNGSGMQEPGEPDLPGVDVVITDSQNNTQTATTNGNGDYSATVPAGLTTANVDEATLPLGYVQTAGNDPTTVNVLACSTANIGNDGYQPQADLAITKTDGVTTATPGGLVTYTITATNNGPSGATGVTVSDMFPAGITAATWTCVGAGGGTCTAAGSGDINDVVNLPAGASVTYTVGATISPSAAGTLSNTATIAVPGGVTDPNPANNSATDTDVLIPRADLSIIVADSEDPVMSGAVFSYTLDVSNAGPSNATDVSVANTLPAGVANVIASGAGWSCDESMGIVTCTRASLSPGAAPTITITVTAPAASGDITNAATVSSAATDLVPGNDSDMETTTVSCEIDIVYVNANASGANNGASWADAFTDLQDALALANTCTVNQIWVAEGTYYPDQGVGYTPGERTHSFVMKNNLAIYGGFPNTGGPGFGDRDWAANVTILSGDIGSPGDVGDNSYHVVFNNNNGLNSTAKLDGFTISGGNANNNSNGGGMYNKYSSPTVTHCTFSGNFTSSFGAGMYNENASTTVSNCAFYGNSANASGGGLTNYGTGSPPTIINCTFSGNSAGFRGGGMHNDFAVTTQVVNCTFSGNSAFEGGGMYNDAVASPTVANCIFWGNGTELAKSTNTPAPSVTYSIVQQASGVYPGMGNLNIDPLFVSATDLHLQACSPAIDAGTAAGAPANDLDGNARPFDAAPNVAGNIDIGAYEYQGLTTAPVASCQNITVQLGVNNTVTVLASQIDDGSTGCGLLSFLIDGQASLAFDCDGLGPQMATLTVTDAFDNQATCNATITVADDDNPCCAAPAAACKPFTAVLAGGSVTLTAGDVDGGSTYECGLQSMTVSPNTFTCADAGPQTVTLTVTDINNESSACNAQVTVKDETPPVARCKNITIELNANGQASITAVQVNNGSTDNCGLLGLSLNRTSFGCADVGMRNVLLTATDAAGNSHSCVSTVIVQDNTDPEALCQNTTIQLDAGGSA
ncbi:MAG: DUF11 domain-containing protein, partial [Phaeodactylibacter sp.]|nr:DUF11 domain-containing protein [Phaeodactylibacter sp.]